MKNSLTFSTAFLMAVISSSCSSTQPAESSTDVDNPPTEKEMTALAPKGVTAYRTSLDRSLLAMPMDPFRLGPGDVVDIELIGTPEGVQRTLVGPDGKIYFHLLPGQQVWGLTLGQTQRTLESGLGSLVKNPKVSLTLREIHSRRVWVLGRVVRPGIYPLDQPMTLLEAVSKAGGLFTSRMSGSTEELADLNHSFLIREGKMLPVDFHKLIREGDTSQNIYVKADDFVYLPSALGSEVYVLGAVNQPRSVAFKNQVSLMTALAHCRGLTDDAKPKRVAIVSGSLQSPSIAIVDAQAIMTGRSPDILLKPRDIVYVPSRPTISLANYAKLVVNTFARTVAANEGVRAGGGSDGVGVNIGLGQ